MIHINDLFEKSGLNLPKNGINENFNPMPFEKIRFHAKRSVVFYIGDVSKIDNIKPIDCLINLPFDPCWFEMDFKTRTIYLRVGCLAIQNGTDISLNFFVYIKQERTWVHIGESMILKKIGGLHPKSYTEFEWGIPIIYLGSAFIERALSAINCSNVIRVEHKPDEKLQKARIKRGKKPLFSYWTLQLSIPNEREEGASLGGTHASPRLHLRRGHARQYAPGKYTWVQPCAVGNKNLGLVHKDYAITAAYTEKDSKNEKHQ